MLFGTWSRKMNHSAMPRQASIRRSRARPFSSGSLPTISLGVAIRSCIWVTPSWQDEPAAGGSGVSWFTFRDLFLRCHLRPICAPALSFVGVARGQLSHAISAARLRRLTRSPLSRLSEKRRTRLAWSEAPYPVYGLGLVTRQYGYPIEGTSPRRYSSIAC